MRGSDGKDYLWIPSEAELQQLEAESGLAFNETIREAIARSITYFTRLADDTSGLRAFSWAPISSEERQTLERLRQLTAKLVSEVGQLNLDLFVRIQTAHCPTLAKPEALPGSSEKSEAKLFPQLILDLVQFEQALEMALRNSPSLKRRQEKRTYATVWLMQRMHEVYEMAVTLQKIRQLVSGEAENVGTFARFIKGLFRVMPPSHRLGLQSPAAMLKVWERHCKPRQDNNDGEASD